MSFVSPLIRMTNPSVDSTAMESMGIYWVPVYKILEERGFEVVLLNVRDAKNVPGCKTDLLDALSAMRSPAITEQNMSSRCDKRWSCRDVPVGRLSPAQILRVVREHWSIESDCNWTLDMVLAEDDLPMCT